MTKADVTLPVSLVMRDVTMVVKVTGVRTWRARLWVGRHLIYLAAWVIGCGVRVDMPEQ